MTMALEVFRTLYDSSDAAGLGMSLACFSDLLLQVEATYPGRPTRGLQFFQTLQIRDLVLAHACAAGNEAAWDRFFTQYGPVLHQAAAILCGDEIIAREAVTLLIGDLFGTTVDAAGKRRSKLTSYSGRGSLAAWLRATLAQACIDQHRVRRRFISMDVLPFLVDQRAVTDGNVPVDPRVGSAVETAIRALAPEKRLLLKAHYLDQMTLAEIAKLMGMHESTISRRLGRVTRQLRRSILECLVKQGLSVSAALEALGSDVRQVPVDIEGALVRVV